jgi:hypothetical protein
MPFGGGQTDGPNWGTNVTRTNSFWDPVSLGQNMQVELSLGPKMGGLNIKAPICTQVPSLPPPNRETGTVHRYCTPSPYEKKIRKFVSMPGKI